MKIIVLIFVILIFAVPSLFAQNFYTTVENTSAEGEPGTEIVLDGWIYNLSTKSLDIELTRKTNSLPDNWTSSLCLNICVAPHVNTIFTTIPVSDSAEFSIHFFTDSQPAQGEALLVLKEPDGADSAAYLFTAKTVPSSPILLNDQQKKKFQLLGNYPNPFNNSTTITFETAEATHTAKLRVLNLKGELMIETTHQHLQPGLASISFRGIDKQGNVLPSGIYFYRVSLTTQSNNKIIFFGKFTLLK